MSPRRPTCRSTIRWWADLCVNIELDDGGKRHISRLVTAAARVVGHERGVRLPMSFRMEPWVKLLTHTSDYKAFKNKTVVDILDRGSLAEYPLPGGKAAGGKLPGTRTAGAVRSETDYTDFLQRLMQEWEGIYWWFEHSEDSHTLVLADAISAHKACRTRRWSVAPGERAEAGQGVYPHYHGKRACGLDEVGAG